MTAPSPRPKHGPSDRDERVTRLLSLVVMACLFAFFGWLLVGASFVPMVVDAERPIWESTLNARITEVAGIVFGAVLGVVLHYQRFRR
jgi:hypothetical protein